MKNAFLLTVMGFSLVVSLVSFHLANESYKMNEEAELRIKEIGGEIRPRELVFLKEHDINVISEGYKAPFSFFGVTKISVPVVNQYPELPVGCEIAASTAYLNYIGVDVGKMTLREYISESYKFTYKDGVRKGPDPYRVFVGNPEKNGFGCYDMVVVRMLNRYFDENELSYKAMKVEGATQTDLETLLDGGVPVIVWASLDMRPFEYPETNEWILETTGEEFCWPKNSHALVLCGYDENDYYFSDSNNKDDIVKYKKSVFLDRWEEFGSQGVIVVLDGESEEKNTESE